MFRILIVFTIAAVSFVIPNINILLTVGGALLGTIVNILLPVLFYNRAFNNDKKNLKLERPHNSNDMEEDQQKLLEGDANKEAADPAPEDEEEDIEDNRAYIKVCNWIVLFIGTVIGIVGLTYVVIELINGAKEDEA
jgi:hypothetical protein